MAKGKSILHHCAHCDRTTKMEVIGPVETQPDKTWYRCTRCRHATLIDLAALRLEQENSQRKPERADCLEYRPENSYSIGTAIFHAEWGIGKVVSKERTSGGDRAIVVAFEKLGERKLLENVVAEPESGH
ncbi:MAG: hypothetical protein AB1428_03030 [Bacteroidota bacterium]